MARINKSKTLTNIYHLNVNVKLMLENVIQIKSGTITNVDVSVKIWKKKHVCEKGYIWNPGNCTCKNAKYLGDLYYWIISITGDSVINCDKIIKVTKTILK